MSPKEGRRDRRRITFEIDSETAQLLREVKTEGIISEHDPIAGLSSFALAGFRTVLISALREGKRGAPLLLETPQSLPDFLSSAKNEIVIVGTTLASLHEEGVVEALEKKIAKGRMAMSFILLDPEAIKAYNSLNQGRAAHELDQTYQLLLRLQDLGIREGDVVRIVGTLKMPSMGIAITDPFTDAMKVRVELFSDPHYQTKPHPFFQIDATTEAGNKMCGEFLAYYMPFLEGERVVGFRAPSANSSKR